MSSDRLAKLRKTLRLHTNWLTVKLLGEDAVSEEELAALKKSGKLPLGDEVGLAEKSFILGRLRALLKTSEYKDLDYKKLEEFVNNPDLALTPLEELAMQEAKLHAATYVKKLADDIAAGAFDRFGESFSEVLTEASVKEVIKDKTALAVKERQSYDQLASNLVKELKTTWHRDWRMLAETELHRAKMRGTAMAIINQVDIYSNSEGIDSDVSIIPNPDTCEDCTHHYLDDEGNPRVFKLRKLFTKGSNGEKNVKHTRGPDGRHTGWKTTLPPLHPRCGCRLVYVPPGMSWKQGKLQVTNEKVYQEAISKAVDRGSMSPTIKPPGPKSTQNANSPASKAAKPPSVPGIAAPGNSPGPGRPPSVPSPEDSSPKQDMVDCPFGGGDECRKHGGTGGKHHAMDSESMKNHQKALARGAKPEDPEAATKVAQDLIQDSVQWGKTPKEHNVVLEHLTKGPIAHRERLDVQEGSEKGINESWRASIAGNGRACMKPPPDWSQKIQRDPGFITAGVGTVPHGTSHKREVGAYKLFTAFGLDYCPPTELRTHTDGKSYSMQQWQENYNQAGIHVAGLSATDADLSAAVTNAGEGGGGGSPPKKSTVQSMLSLSADKEATKNALFDIVSMDIVMNSNDRHLGNIMVSDDFTDIKAIDHGVSFGTGMMGYHNVIHKDLHSNGYKVKLSETLQERFKNTSFGDLKRSLGDHLEDWEIGQTFLRMQYALHLQETDGHLDYNKFQPYYFTATEDTAIPNKHMWLKGSDRERQQEAVSQIMERRRSHDLFEDFAIDFLDTVAEDPSHPHHEAAKELKDIGVFMGPGFAPAATEYRQSGKHKEYEKKIRKEKEEAQVTRKMKQDFNPPSASRGIGSSENPAAEIESDKRGFFSRLLGKKEGKKPESSEASTPKGKVKQDEISTPKGKIQQDEMSTPKGKHVKKSLFLADPDKGFTLDK